MPSRIETLFRGSRFLFWSLVPVSVLAGFVLFISVDTWTPRSIAITAALESALLLLVLVLWRPVPFRWAGRALAGEVFFAYAAYFVSELLAGHFGFPSSRAQPSVLNSALGLIFIGLPCLKYAVLGYIRKPLSSSDADADQPSLPPDSISPQ